MRPRPTGALRGRFVFAVGKGGVGKTTTAGAIAVALADAGESTRLVSTDPAHSLGDLFEQGLGGGGDDEPGAPCECAPGLVLEEFDAAAHADRWLRRAAEPIGELVERGTYLDAEDVSRFVDLSLPGVDEVMAALRLAELEATATDRIVVDTAPTGHLLRLIDSDAVIRGWATALSAMAEKARVVASHLVGRRVRFTGEDVVEELEASTDRFRREVLASGDFVVVTTPEPVVRAESDRLVSDLERRGLRVTMRVQTGESTGRSNAWTVPRRPGARGCRALRALLASATPPAESGAAPEAAQRGTAAPERPAVAPPPGGAAARRGRANPEPGVDDWLAGLPDLVLVVGKGGVGKSTCAAACALALAQRARSDDASPPVTLFSTDPAGSLADVFECVPSADGFKPAPGLVASQITAQAAFERLRRRYRRDVERLFADIGLDRAATLDRAVLDSLWNFAPPGIDELMALTSMLGLDDRRGRWIVDAAPTGHFLRLIEMPGVALEWTHTLMRVLLKQRAVVRLEGTAERLLRFARRVKALRRRLRDPERTAAVVVTLDEPMVRAESARLAAALDRAGIPPGAIVRNRAGAGDTEPEEVEPGATIGGAHGDGARRIRAPLMPAPPVGKGALRRFIEQWELVS